MRIGVIGAGSWGTTLALYLNRLGHEVTLWAYEKELVEEIHRRRENSLYLPGVHIDESLQVTVDLEEAIHGKKAVLFVVPSQFYRGVLRQAKPYLSLNQAFISATKGIETGSLMTMSQIVHQEIGRIPYAVLSGPSFAEEVVQGFPTVVTLASQDMEMAGALQKAFASEVFRIYVHDDVIGTELGGAVKNVIAIAVGICDGLGFGLNARAALITRGLYEMIKLGVVLGANPMTFAGLSGLGDLILTCTGDLSRNRTLGLQIGRGTSLEEVTRQMKAVAEGVETTRSLKRLAERHGIEMPITEQVYMVLFEKKDPREAVSELMTRTLKREWPRTEV
jgi:glycerol-3-phosphate dehydrogenase (NAD(P)+)